MDQIAIDLSRAEEYLDFKLCGSNLVCSIYKVPGPLRKVREEAYTPRLVSIGPLHYGTIYLQTIEETKIIYANSYFSKFPNSERGNFVEEAKLWETKARACYEDIINLSSYEFICMTLVDGTFVVEFLMKYFYPDLREDGDQIFQNQWLCKEILHDMMLLENQLPFFVIEYLFDRLKKVRSLDISLLNLVTEIFGRALKLKGLPDILLRKSEIFHLVDLLYFVFNAQHENIWENRWESGKLVDTPSATQLQEAGVKFVGVTKKDPHDIVFDKTRGVLKIPSLVVNQWTDSFLGNMKAYEQCRYAGTMVSSYLILMENLIKTPADVDLLVGSGIIENLQGSSEDVCSLFNNLYKRTTLDHNNFLYTELCTDLNAYSRDYWHQWKAAWYKWKHILKRDYFGNPWTIILVIAVVILLILTLIQTVCSVMALKRPGV